MGVNSICHIEISCKNAARAGRFYEDLFGWNIDNSMGEEYLFLQPKIGVGGALAQNASHCPGDNVIFYVEVDDIDAFLKKAVQLGGKEVRVKTEIPGHGWYGHFVDPDGNKIGLFTGNPIAR